ncbi:V-type ATP synthase subunit I [Patescibacteria group bacterium]|nr:V-type ATP synthase subunit I [Patescibacteria group bacterium]MBU1016383.1 V-type ATP synthase subunit I [Patescibacteria group bacterium]MBU1685459.1 V-type ATP synthase subunit I [Patescibacteria group bacterium]MBU1938730.1 V-type ATP synthase subunit I [Patescibacteria group bacterium]
MAVVPMQKIGLLAYKGDKDQILSFLQNLGVLHLSDASSEEIELRAVELSESLHDLHYKVAELDFAIRFLAPFETKKKGVQAMVDGDSVKSDSEEVEDLSRTYKFKSVVEECKKLEEEMVGLPNERKGLLDLQTKLRPWTQYEPRLSEEKETETACSIFATVPFKEWEALKIEILNLSKLVVLEMDNIFENSVYIHVVCNKSLIADVDNLIAAHKGEMVELPKLEGTVIEELHRIDRRFHEIGTRMKELRTAAGKLAPELRHLRIVYDYFKWQLIKKEADKRFLETDSTVLISGWVPKKGINKIREDLAGVAPGFELMEVEPDEGEEAPVLLLNKPWLKPFEAVTGIYGLPLPNELDPTPLLAVFFIVFFGLALTDAIYGLLMFAIMFSVLRFLKIPKESQKLIRLLMYAGLVTFFAGALFGGWGSMDPSQAPGWLTTTDANGELIFIGQKVNAIKDPMSVLILAFILGYIQVLFGVIVNFVHKFRHVNKKYAMIDNFPWVFILFVIGLLVMVSTGVLPAGLATPIKYLLYVAVAGIVLTQGREKKSIIGKAFSGILGLYGLVGYLSDVLSYSRLLALGLATTIIGLAVNTIAGMVNGVPVVGIVLAIIVLVVGHVFNLGINALGAFIHSGRLQFVEFFTKFLEGGGRAFAPLKKESKYVRLRD